MIKNNRYSIEGKIQRSTKSKALIHGIRVEAWGDTCSGDKLVASTLSNCQGYYRLHINDDELEQVHKGQVAVQIALLDREGNRIYASRDKKRIKINQRSKINIRLRDEQLETHSKTPASLEDLVNTSVSPHAIRSDIEAAIGLIAAPGSKQYISLRRSTLCPGPDFDIIDRLGRDAIEVLGGDVRISERFKFTLENLIQQQGIDIEHRRQTLAYLKQSMEKTPYDSTRYLQSPASSPSSAGQSMSLPIMAAAAYLYGGDFEPEGPLIGTLGVLCQFEALLSLQRYAVDALASQDGLRQFGGIIGGFGGECGPDDGPVRFPPRRRPCIPPVNEDLECARDLADLIRGSSRMRYFITGISPASACAGSLITITGNGFTDEAGRVEFRRRGTGGWISVEADSWTDTQIMVRVPANASCGLQLKIFEETARVCGRFIDIYRRGVLSANFAGAAVDIRSFRVNGQTTRLCVTPDDEISVSWDVCAGETISVKLLDEHGHVQTERTPAPATGSFTYSVPDGNTTRHWRAVIDASGACSPASQNREIDVWIHKRPNLSIQGMEVTQGIQYYRASQHLTDASDRGPDNSLQLVTGKSAWVRVYVRSGQDPDWDSGTLANVTGTLRVERISGGSISTVADLAPWAPGTVTAQANPAYAIERGNINTTLNFVIPAAQMTGRLRLSINLNSPSAPCGGGNASASTTVDVNMTQTIQVAAISIGYNGPNPAGGSNLVLGAPTLANVNTTLPYTLATLPISATFTSRIAGTITLTQPLTDAPSCAGCCSPNWVSLMTQIQAAAVFDGNQANWLYYGIMANGIPMGPVIGCAMGGVGAGAVNNGVTMAHELSHQLGRPHAPCGGVGAGDPGYPAYEPYDPAGAPTAATGEYGLDIRNGAIHPPTDKDFMSYCTPNWISIYGHQQMLNQAPLQSTTFPAGNSTGGGQGGIDMSFSRRDDLISLIGYVDEDNAYHVTHVARVTARPLVIGGTPVRQQAELLNKNGGKLSSAPVHITGAQAQGTGNCNCAGSPDLQPPYTFQALIPYAKGGQILQIRAGKDILWQKKAPAKTVKIRIEKASINKSGMLLLDWSVSADAKARLEYALQWSADNGKSWNGLASSLTENSCCLDISHLPAGSLHVNVLACDGFNTAKDQSKRLRNPTRAPQVDILNPDENAEVDVAKGLLLWGRAIDCHGEPLAEDALLWKLEGKTLGTGSELSLNSLPKLHGKKQLVLIATDKYGKRETKRTLVFPGKPRNKKRNHKNC